MVAGETATAESSRCSESLYLFWAAVSIYLAMDSALISRHQTERAIVRTIVLQYPIRSYDIIIENPKVTVTFS